MLNILLGHLIPALLVSGFVITLACLVPGTK